MPACWNRATPSQTRREDVVGHLVGREIGERTPGDAPGHEHRGVGTGLTDLDELGRVHPLALGPQEDEGLVLDLLEPGVEQRRSGVPVEEEPPRLVQEPGVTLVAPEHRDRERTLRILGEHERAPEGLHRCELEVLGIDTQ